MRYLFPVLIGGVFSAPAFADAPKVVADIAPVHGLVSQVMGDLGTPDLLMRQGSSPHGYAMRPSEAAALQFEARAARPPPGHGTISAAKHAASKVFSKWLH